MPKQSARPARPARPVKPARSTKPTKQAPKKRQSQERARDEARKGGGPRYGGGPWRVADERGDRRFGRARNDDANPSELDRGEAAGEVAGEIESSGQREGIGRTERPRKPKRRAK